MRKGLLLLLIAFFARLTVFAQTITMLYPDGGEVLYKDSLVDIVFQKTGFTGNVLLEYSTAGPSGPWTTIGTKNTTAATTQIYTWTVPAVSSSNCYVRATRVSGGAPSDISNAAFTIMNPSITLTAPNGGENWIEGTVENITWTAQDITTVELEYSTDGGNTWNFIDGGLTGISYSWTIPSVSSVNCLVRAYDSQFPAFRDSSNSVFGISANNITVNTPNGGESLTGGNNYNVTWSATAGITYLNLYYSTDGGNSWIFYNDGIPNNGSYTWPVPSVSSTQCRVKLEDMNNNTTFDISDANFTITSSAITLTAPNGGESWYNGNTHSITWNPGTASAYVVLSYSLDGGANWIYINTVSNTGSYNWQLLGISSSTQCRIKIEDYNNNTISDISDANFTINGATYAITQPNGGEILNPNQNYYINWNTSNGSYYVYLYYSTDGGASWNYITSTNNNGSYYWTVPVIPTTSGTCLVKVEDYYNNQIFDISDANFTINAASLTLTYPNGGETFNSGSAYNITWTGAGSTYLYIYYSLDGGANWNYVTGTNNTGSYNWTVPSVNSSTQCRIKLVDYNNSALFDISDANFTINGTSYTLLNPNGGESLNSNQQYTVNWTQTNASQYAYIYYSTDNGLNWNYITTVNNTGSYSWTVPVIASTSAACLFKVEDYNNTAIYDVSDAPFTINGANYTVTYPNGGEVFNTNSNYTITWTGTTGSSYVYLYYSLDGGVNWTSIATPSNTGSYNWTVPSVVSSTQCRIKVVDYTFSSVFDISDADFTINGTTLNVNSPNGGESLTQNQNYTITWSSTNASSNVYLYYSTNSGAGWNYIGTTTNTGAFNWTVPNVSSCACRIRVYDQANTSIYDDSDADFCIGSQNCQFASSVIGYSTQYSSTSWSANQATGAPNVYPNYGDNTSAWASSGGDNQREWLVLGYSNPAPASAVSVYETYAPGAVDTVYVRNASNGQWNMVWSGTAASAGSTARIFTVTFTQTSYNVDAVRLAINSPAVSSWNEIDAVCLGTQTATNQITVTSPNGGESWLPGSSHNITWSSTGVTNVKIEYSSNTGSTWNTIVSSVSSTGTYSWSIPSAITQSCNYLIKISDASNANTYDVSNNTFCVSNPTITVTTPNGGEQWTQNTYEYIYWTSNGASAYVTIDYSTDGGSSWSTAAGIVSNTGYYNWYVNSAVSCQTKIRVKDYYNNLISDESDTNFCVNAPTPTVNLTSPNGGENWSLGTTQAIQWSSSNITDVKLEYTVNNGTSWTTITGSTNASAGYYSWTIPTSISPSCNARIRISDATNPAVRDSSNSTFCLRQPVITVSYPNGGETLQGGQYYNITWSSQYISNYVIPEYSTDNGATWIAIASYAYNNGNYNWYVPNVSSTQCLVRIKDYYTNSIKDSSNATFTILPVPPSVTVTYPNGGETFVVNANTYIQWTSVSISTVNVFYSIDNGATWTQINGAPVNASNNYINWTVPNTPSTYCKVKVQDASGTTNDVSNNLFTISPPYIIVNSPNGGESWGVGTSQYISWNAPGVSTVNIEYSVNNGVTWTSIVNNYNAASNYYYWNNIPNTPSCQVLVRVKDSSNPNTIFDLSNNTFCIPAPVLTVTTPNGNESWGVGTNHYIYWSSNFGGTAGTLEYSTDNGVTWTTISNVNTSTGYYNWNVANAPSCSSRVRISESTYGLSDMSDNTFCIVQPNITVTSPNGGEQWMATTTHPITWTSNGVTAYVKIDYSIDNGNNWISIASGVNNSGTYNWYVPNNPSSQCLIRVSDYTYSSYYDVSNAVFEIVQPTPTVTLTQPNGGQNWGIGTQQYIYWNSVSVTDVKLEYSTNGGSNYTTIIASTPASQGYYVWTIPNTPSQNCLVRISDATNASVNDVSNAAFTIPPPALALTSPNGGEVWGVSSSHYIYWNATSIPNVKLEYSLNNGVVWNTIVASTNGYNGYYYWTLPNTASNTCKVRVSSVTNPNINDVSNGIFSIVNPSITVTAPNGGESWTGLTYHGITWTSSGASSYVNIAYSTDNGSTWNAIANGASNTGSYNWYVANTSSSQCKIRVTDYYNNTITDMSNSVFNINAANPSLTLYSPNGGENWLIGSGYYISWTATSVQNIKIEYSADAGSTWNNIAASISASNGSYYWIVPNTPTLTAKVRITDVSGTTNDISNNNFIISQPIPALSLTSPDGGENWQIGSYQYITWTSTLVNNIKIERSDNNGASWSTLANPVNASNGYYYYYVNGPASNQCRIKITDISNSYLRDSSASVYSESTPVVNTNTLSVDTLSELNYCKGDTLSVPYTANGVFNAGNQYTVQLSDSSGSFSNPVAIGQLSATALTGNIAAVIPDNILNGVNYHIRVVASDLPTTGNTYSYALRINSPEFDFTPSSQLIKYIPNSSVQFTYQGDTTGIITYNWQFGNGDTSALMSPVYIYNTIGFYTVSATVTSNAGCSTTVTKTDLIDVEQIFPSIPLGNLGNGNNFGGVASSVSGDTVYAVGANGTMLYSYNGGVSWTAAQGVPQGNYTGVTIASGATPNSTYICVSGQGGYLAFSNNGGQSWGQVNNANSGTNNMNDVAFFSNSGGVAVGENGSLVTYNGSSWSNQTATIGSSISLNGAAMLNNNTAIVVGNSGTIGQFTISTNTWTPINTGLTGNINAVAFVDADTGYAAGDNGIILKSVDAGASWTTVFSGGISSNFVSVTIDTTIHAVLVVGDDGVVYQSLFGGPFERYSIGNTANQKSISSTKGKGIIVGDAGGAFRFGRPDIGVGTLPDTSFCAGASIAIPYSVSGSFNQGNVFSAQLSDANGNFTSPAIIGSITSTDRDTIMAEIPVGTPAGTGYRIRIVSTDSALVGNDNGKNLDIIAAPSVNLGSDTTLCPSDVIVLDAGNAGSSYSWNNAATTQTISVNSTGNYEVTVTNAGGCTVTDNINVTVINTQFNIDLGSDINACDNAGIVLDAGIAGLSYTWNTGEHTQTLNVSNAGTYIVSASRCSFSDSDTINISISTSPVFSLGNDTTVCGNITLSGPAGTGLSYQWLPGNDTTRSYAVNASGMYGLTVTNQAGCSSTEMINITVNPGSGNQPVITQSGNTMICTASGATSYQWYMSNGNPIAGATNATYSTTSAGDYYVIVNGGLGCDSQSATFSFQPDGIYELTNTANVVVYPNPNNGEFILEFNLNTIQRITVRITDVVGNEVFAENANNFIGKYRKNISINEFSDGIYLVQVITDNSNFMQKVIVQR